MKSIISSQNIKPIETRYRGYRFRSRLEARWAVAFDHMGIKWEYETEGYHLPSGKMYLPDFLLQLTNRKLWVEIKPSGGDTSAFQEFIKLQPFDGTVLNEIPSPDFYSHYYEDNLDCPIIWFGNYQEWGDDYPYIFCICNKDNHVVGFEFLCESDRACGHPECQMGFENSIIRNAFRAARAARFEHGERP